jgi:hypothetical protein
MSEASQPIEPIEQSRRTLEGKKLVRIMIHPSTPETGLRPSYIEHVDQELLLVDDDTMHVLADLHREWYGEEIDADHLPDDGEFSLWLEGRGHAERVTVTSVIIHI